MNDKKMKGCKIVDQEYKMCPVCKGSGKVYMIYTHRTNKEEKCTYCDGGRIIMVEVRHYKIYDVDPLPLPHVER